MTKTKTAGQANLPTWPTERGSETPYGMKPYQIQQTTPSITSLYTLCGRCSRSGYCDWIQDLAPTPEPGTHLWPTNLIPKPTKLHGGWSATNICLSNYRNGWTRTNRSKILSLTDTSKSWSGCLLQLFFFYLRSPLLSMLSNTTGKRLIVEVQALHQGLYASRVWCLYAWPTICVRKIDL